MKPSVWVATAVALMFAGSAGAVMVVGGVPPSPDAVRQSAASIPAVPVDESQSIREGVVMDIGTARDQIQVNGSWLKVVGGTTHIFRQGRAATVNDIAKGQTVRFTLARGAADRLTLGAIYVP